jgi:hypothetical protein
VCHPLALRDHAEELLIDGAFGSVLDRPGRRAAVSFAKGSCKKHQHVRKAGGAEHQGDAEGDESCYDIDVRPYLAAKASTSRLATDSLVGRQFCALHVAEL